MRTPLFGLSLAAVLAGSASMAAGQTYVAPEPRARTFGLEVAVALPVEDGIDLWLGGFARIHVPVSPNLTVTGRLGVLKALIEDTGGFDVSVMAFPLYGGVAYSLAPEGGLYIAGEAGLTVVRASVSFDGQSDSDSETELGLTLGAGYKQGSLDGRLALWFPTIEESDSLAIMATVGFDITRF